MNPSRSWRDVLRICCCWACVISGITEASVTYPAGNSPVGVIFDGTNIWVANNTVNTVTKLRPSDGAVLGTFPVGRSPNWLAFDGTNIWVSNFTESTVTKLRASDGVAQGTFYA